MAEQYFAQNPASPHAVRTFDVTVRSVTLTLQSDAGTFSKDGLDPGSALLLKTLPDEISGTCLDVGCGWGAMGLWIAKKWPQTHVTLTDINERAVALCRANALANGLSVTVLSGDGITETCDLFDTIVINPPIRAGKTVVYRLLQESVEHLAPNGSLYAVIRKQQGAPSALSYLKTLSPNAVVVERGGGYWIIRVTV